jgi:hypothetical protein
MNVIFFRGDDKAHKPVISSAYRVLTTSKFYCNKQSNDPTFRIEHVNLTEFYSDQNINTSYDYFANLDFLSKDLAVGECIVFIDACSMFARNPDHLWSASNDSSIQVDIQFMEDRKERLRGSPFAILLTVSELEKFGHRFVASPGIFTVSVDKQERISSVWREILKLGKDLEETIREKAVWNKTLIMLAGEMTQKPFERGEVIPVREGEIDWDEVRNACIVSVSDWKDEKAKEHFLRCLYFGHFFGDESGLMLNILDP